MTRTITDNTGEGEHNWITQLRNQIENVPTSDGVVVEDLPPQATGQFDPWTVQDCASTVGADFDVLYVASGYIHPATGEHVVPVYPKGTYKGDPADQYLLRSDTHEVIGNMSGRYPEREGYKHVFDTLEELFPRSCETVTVYGKGERVVVQQVLDDPVDLGGGDFIQPYIYTRMSLNGTWKTEIIPVTQRLACENMLGFGGQLIGVRATKNHDTLLTMRSSVIELAMAQSQTLQNMALILTDQDFTDGMFTEMLDIVIPRPEQDAHHKTETAIFAKRGACWNAWRTEREDHPTAWGAYNAMQGAEQHRINTGGKSTEAAKERALVKALDGNTPIADAAERYLLDLVLVSAEEPF
jgi:hypothetical protein